MTDRQPGSLGESWTLVREQLAIAGFNLSAVLDCDVLNRDTEIESVPQTGRLLLLGAGGNLFWRRLRAYRDAAGKPLRPDPDQADTHVVDDYCVEQIMDTVGTGLLKGFNFRLLYPGDCDILLPALGDYLGWSTASPLGLGIHRQYGLWWAYRVLCWTDAPLPVDVPVTRTAGPCSTCEQKPCITACPADAVSTTVRFNLNACAKHRTARNSNCVDRCLARLACPVALDQRQDLEQHQYHQRRSMRGMLDWLRDTETDSN